MKDFLFQYMDDLLQNTHYEKDVTLQWIQMCIVELNLQKTIQGVTQNCMTCAKNNPKTAVRPSQMGTQHREISSLKDWRTDFTQMPQTVGNFRYLLVLVHTFSGKLEAYPTQTEKSSKVIKTVLKKIIPLFGLPNTLQSDNGPAFVFSIIQQVSKVFQIIFILETTINRKNQETKLYIKKECY